jgi:hypothetical protein
MVYDRTAATPASAMQTPAKRSIGGLARAHPVRERRLRRPADRRHLRHQQRHGHNTTVYHRTADGDDAPPDREFVVMAGNFGIGVDESRQEFYITEQRESAITVWKKTAGMKDTAVRLIQGDQTKLADPHGIAFDPKSRLLYVVNYGTSHVVRKGSRRHAENPELAGKPWRQRNPSRLWQVRDAVDSRSTRRTSTATCRHCARSRGRRR